MIAPRTHIHPGLHILLTALLVVLLALAFCPTQADGQPFGAWLVLGGTHGYLEVPHHPALNPVSGITIETWLALDAPGPGQCVSIVGKDFQQAWWLGFCHETLRSFTAGGTSVFDRGTLPDANWHHIAVTSDGSTRRHYIDGMLVGQHPEPVPLSGSTAPVRIGSDVSWPFSPSAAIDEVRLWSYARTTAQIRATINRRLTTPQPGLVAVWSLDNAMDALGVHNGTLHGGWGALTFPVAPGCTTTATQLCLHNRFLVTVEWRDFADHTGHGTLVPLATSESGLFWFFAPSNWELMVKVLPGCPLTHHWWFFSAAATSVFYRVEVMDVVAGYQRIYFNYLGVSAPAVTDTGAIPTCPP